MNRITHTICICLTFILFLSFCSCGIEDEYDADSFTDPVHTELEGNSDINVYSDTGNVYRGELVMIPDGNVHFQQMVDAGEYIYLYGKESGNQDVIYRINKESLASYRIIPPEHTIITRLTPAAVNEFCDIQINEDGEYSVLCMDKNLHWSELSLPMLNEYEENALLWIYETEGGYIAVTANKILALNRDGTKNKEISTHSGQTGCFYIGNGKTVIISEVPAALGEQAKITKIMVIDKEFNVVENYTSKRTFGGYYYAEKDGGRIICSNQNTVFAFDYKNDTVKPLINLSLSGMNPSSLIYGGQDSYFSLKNGALYLWKSDDGKSPILMTIAAYNLSMELKYYIDLYNGISDKYKIEIIDYATYDDVGADGQGLNRLRADIISGSVPDMLDLANLPAQLYAEHGILEDLKPYLSDKAPVSYNSFIPSAVKALEYNGSLYYITPEFQIGTVCGSEAFVGDSTTWSPDDFFAAVEGMNPVDAVGPETTKEVFFSYVLTFLGKEYIDYTEGKCHFNDTSFIEFIRFASSLPDECDYYALNSMPAGRAYTGKQPIIIKSLGSSMVSSIAFDDAIFGGEAHYVGFPTNYSNGTALVPSALLAMSAGSQNKEGVIDFIYFILSDNAQISGNKIPIVQRFLPGRIEEWEMSYEDSPNKMITICDDVRLEIVGKLAPENTGDRIKEIIDRIDCTTIYDEAILDIIMQECQPYFSGQGNAEQSAINIQSKAQLYIAEQYG